MAGHVDVDSRRTLQTFLVQGLGQDEVLLVDPQRPVARGQSQVDVFTHVTLDTELTHEAAHCQVLFDKETRCRTSGLWVMKTTI